MLVGLLESFYFSIVYVFIAFTKRVLLKCMKITVLVLLTFVYSASWAQDFVFKSKPLSVENGLMMSRHLNYFYQDRQHGYIWMSTDDGLHRYDGVSTKVYDKSHGLYSNVIDAIAEDHTGLLWLAHYQKDNVKHNIRAISIFDLKQEKAIPISEYLQLPFKEEAIANFHPSSNQSILFLVKPNKLFKYSSNGMEEVISGLDERVVDRFVSVLNNNGFYWFSNGQRIFKYTSKGDFVSQYPTTPSSSFLWGLQEHIYSSNQLHPKFQGEVNSLDKARILWIDTTKQLSLFQDHAYFYLKNFNGEIKGKHKHHTTLSHQVYVDHHDNIWIHNNKGQVNVFSWSNKNFSLLPGSNTRGITQNKDDQIIFNQYGIIAQNGQKTTELLPSFKNRELLALTQTNQKHLYFGDYFSHLFRYNITTKLVETFSYATDSFPQDQHNFWALHIDKNHKLWLGHNHGLSYLDTLTRTLKHFQNYNDYDTLKTSTIYDFHENEQGIWLATTKGLFLLHATTGIIKHIHTNGITGMRLSYDQILHIHEDKNGLFWLASRGGGLLFWNPKTGEYGQFTIRDGLPHNVIYEVYEDDYNNLWMGSNHGLICFDKKTHQVRVFTEKDGIANNEFNTISHYQAQDGTMYFGGLKGITVFHPKDFVKDSSAILNKKIFIEKVEVQNESDLLVSCPKIDDYYTFLPSHKNLSIHYNFIDFLDGERVSYSYRIKELDTKWIDLERKTLRFNSLPHGKFTILIRAKLPHIGYTKPIAAKVHVVLPFYLHVWFIFFIVFVVATLIYALFQYRLKRLKRAKTRLEEEVRLRTKTIENDKLKIEEQAEKLKRIDELKNHFFANISHELRTPLTLISSPIQNIKEELDTESVNKISHLLKLVERNTNNLQELVDSILDLSKLEANRLTLEKEEIQIEYFIKKTFANFQSHAKFLEIDYQLFIEELTHQWIWGDSDKLQKILNNLLSNAIKFTAKGKTIHLCCSQKDNQLIIEVRDTGKGIDAEDLPHIFERFFQGKKESNTLQGGTGIGLSFASELAQLMHGSLTAESTVGEGSRFVLTIPLEKANPPKNKCLEEPLVQHLTSMDVKQAQENQAAILLVEDNLDMHAYIKSLLVKQFYIHSASNGLEALDILEAHPTIQLILSDLMMPELDGVSLLKKLKATPAWCSIPFIMLTAVHNEATKIDALTLGLDDYLTKPFSSQELLIRINNAAIRVKERQHWIKQTALLEQTNSDSTVFIETEDNTTPKELAWLKQVERIIRSEIENAQFKQEDLADRMNLSKRQLFRKIKKITGLSILGYKREITLQLARELLEAQTYDSIQAVSYSVGFKNTNHFSKLYTERFGKKPAEYM